MKEIVVVAGQCPANHPCPVLSVCPTEAITQANWHSEPSIDKDKCTNCGLCTRYCGYGAFAVVKS